VNEQAPASMQMPNVTVKDAVNTVKFASTFAKSLL